MSYCDFCDLNFDCSMDEHSLSDGHLRKMSGGNVTTLPDIKQVDNPHVPPRAAEISGSENVHLSERTRDNESVLGSSRREREANEKQRRQREQMSREILGHRADKSRSRAADHKSKTPRDLSDRKQQQKYHYKAPNVESSQPSHNKWPGRSYPPVNQCDA
eukprot:720611_1